MYFLFMFQDSWGTMLKLPLCISFFYKFCGLLCVQVIPMCPFHEVLCCIFLQDFVVLDNSVGVYYVLGLPLVRTSSNYIDKKLSEMMFRARL